LTLATARPTRGAQADASGGIYARSRRASSGFSNGVSQTISGAVYHCRNVVRFENEKRAAPMAELTTPRLTPKHLFAMPCQKLSFRQSSLLIGFPEGRPMNRKKIRLQSPSSVNPRRHENPTIFRNRDRPAIHSLVMNAAASKPVIHRIRSPNLNPANMRRFQTQIGTIQLNAVATERAAMAPHRHHSIAKRTIPRRRPRGSAQFQTDSLANAFMQRLREMTRQNLPRNFANHLWPASQILE